MIKAVIFDLDNTLYNFDAANEAGLQALAAYAAGQFGWDYAETKRLYTEEREAMTRRMGDVSVSHNRLIRFQNLLEKRGLPLYPHALQMAKSYWGGVLDAMEPAAGARETLSSLRRNGLRLGLGTDMTSYIQYEKMLRLGLLEYMDFIVTSEEAGTDKPGRDLFLLCAQKAGSLPEECLFIGDNIIRDYGGAVAAGMQARWFIPPWKKDSLSVSLLTPADGVFPEQASKDLLPAFASAIRRPDTAESRAILEAVPRIYTLPEILKIV